MQSDSEDDGLFGTPQEREFFDGAERAKPKPPPPQPIQAVPPLQLRLNKKRLRYLPHNPADGIVQEVCEIEVIEVGPGGVKAEQGQLITGYYGDDGVVLTPRNYRRDPKSGLVYSTKNAARCSECGRKCYGPLMVASLFDATRRLCPFCAEDEGRDGA